MNRSSRTPCFCGEAFIQRLQGAVVCPLGPQPGVAAPTSWSNPRTHAFLRALGCQAQAEAGRGVELVRMCTVDRFIRTIAWCRF
eukprot:scaffold1982_cov358-Pavlova_lutheri.AAC.13